MDQLRTEVLREIFEYLDNPSFISMLQVCKRLNNLITKISSIRNNLYVEVNPDNIYEMREVSKIIPFTRMKITSNEVSTIDEITYRNHLTSSMELKGGFETLEDEIWEIICTNHKNLNDLKLYGLQGGFVKFLLTFCQNLSSLRLSFISVLNLQCESKGIKRKWCEDECEIMNKYRRKPQQESCSWHLDVVNKFSTSTDKDESQVILDSYDFRSHMGKIQRESGKSEKSHMYNFDINKIKVLRNQISKVPQNHFVNLKFLTFLEIFQATDALTWIQAPSLVALKIHDCVDFDYICNFLMRCEKLKKLTFTNLKSFSVKNFDNYLFKLEILKIVMTKSMYADVNTRNIVSFVDFLISQKESLKAIYVDFNGISWSTPIILNTIILDLKVESLGISNYTGLVNVLDLKPNKFVKTLLLSFFMNYKNLELTSIFPSATSIFVMHSTFIDFNVFEKIANSMEDLEELTINLFSKNNLPCIMKNVKNFKIHIK